MLCFQTGSYIFPLDSVYCQVSSLHELLILSAPIAVKIILYLYHLSILNYLSCCLSSLCLDIGKSL